MTRLDELEARLDPRLRRALNEVMPRLEDPAEPTTPSAEPTQTRVVALLEPADTPRRSATWIGIVAAGLLAVVGGTWWLADTRNNPAPSTASSGSDGVEGSSTPLLSTLIVGADAGRWLDLPSEPSGLSHGINLDLAATTVCTTAVARGDELVCTALEGQIASHYVPDAAGPDADETLYEVSTRTIFSDAPLSEVVDGYLDNGGTYEPTTIRDSDGFVIEDDATTTLVWSEWPGTATMLRVANSVGRDLFQLADALVEQQWPTSVTPPVVAFNYGYAWGRSGNNHPYALATVGRDGEVCIAVSFASTDPETGGTQVCTDGPPTWTIGTISVQSASDDAMPDEQDVLAGLVPPDVTTVQINYADGTTTEVPTVPVPGLSHRAFGAPTGQPQGSPIQAELEGLDASGNLRVEGTLVAIMPTVVVDTVCFAPGAIGIVPDVIGQDLVSAYQEIRDAGLIIALPVVADHLPTVVDQEPAAGTDRGCGDVLLTTTP